MPYNFSDRLRRLRLDPLEEEDDELLPYEDIEEGYPESSFPVAPAAPPPLATRANTPVGPALPAPPSLPPVAPSTQPLPAAPPTLPERPSKSALELAKEAIQGMPQRPRPGLLRGALATGVAALGGFYSNQIPREQTQQAAENILYPGYKRRMEDWGQQAQSAGALADIELKQAQERRLEAQHGAAMQGHTAQLESERARQEYYRTRRNMPAAPKPFTTYEAYLVSQIQNGSPEEKEAAQAKLDELKAKNSPERNLRVERIEDEVAGTVVLRFYDPHTGELVKEEKPLTARKRPPGNTPLSQDTLTYRKKLSQARELAGKALKMFPNDRAKARDWLAQQTDDDEIFELAMERIGNPPAQKTDSRAAVRAMLGIEEPGGAGGASGATPAKGNPYRQPKKKK